MQSLSSEQTMFSFSQHLHFIISTTPDIDFGTYLAFLGFSPGFLTQLSDGASEYLGSWRATTGTTDENSSPKSQIPKPNRMNKQP
ncbi:hypothetical protein Forpe1208_v009191 [Fusarium oxysporum f. sp. rapae]|uniref:Uncharacterized protein n=1 Tax=Fusarium oxysporum f. sp. rapae TaxID=485398 RepID=A0A8J5TVS2_FUSOX|nr:hypothetical protein Forpe1208_v009191 [Fusarium oxysporum f. sp. rapae]